MLSWDPLHITEGTGFSVSQGLMPVTERPTTTQFFKRPPCEWPVTYDFASALNEPNVTFTCVLVCMPPA